MKKFEYVITESAGIHVRTAGMFVKTVTAYNSNITIEKDGQTANVKSIIALDVRCKEKVTLRLNMKMRNLQQLN